MGTADNLRDIIKRQKEILSALEAAERAIEGSDLAKENAKLRQELEELRAGHEILRGRAEILTGENAGLKNALYEQIYNEKLRLVNATAEKLEIYFRFGAAGELNRLTALERGVTERINYYRALLAKNNIDARDELYGMLDELGGLLYRRVTEARATHERMAGAFTAAEREELERLKAEPLSEEQVLASAKKNSVESFVGLRVLNVVGVLLLIIGAIALSRGVTMFLLGGAMLVLGELMNRRKPTIFSLGMTAGGVGVLYAALATSYFSLGLLGAVPAIIICALIAAVAFVLSLRYHSQTIAAFALVGGYLPMFSAGFDAGSLMRYGVMLYFVGLNLLSFLISFHKKWRVVSFIGLSFTVVGTSFLCFLSDGGGGVAEQAAVILYALFAFLIYTAIPIIGTYRARLRFQTSDVVLLAVNTVCGSLLLYGVFHRFGLRDYDGLLAIAFAAVYVALGRFVEKKFAGDERYTRELFYLTALAFVILVIPFQLGVRWLSLGWLAEGVLLAVFGILRDLKGFRQKGFVICALCLAAFLFVDVPAYHDGLFVYQYLAVTLGSAAILGAYMITGRMAGPFVRVYKYFALTNVWGFLLYLIGQLADHLPPLQPFDEGYLVSAVRVTVTLLFAYAIPRVRLFATRGVRILAVALYVVGVLWLAFINTVFSPSITGHLLPASYPVGVTVTGSAILVALGVLSALAVRDVMKITVTEREVGIEWLPIIVSGYCVVVLTQNLITQFSLAFSSAVISVIYAVTALVWILFGFVRRYAFIRRFGLGLSILAVAKLFLVDLSGLEKGYRVASYFALGVALIGISFVYQYFSRRLEIREAAHGQNDS